jgi:hypothetical protein
MPLNDATPRLGSGCCTKHVRSLSGGHVQSSQLGYNAALAQVYSDQTRTCKKIAATTRHDAHEGTIHAPMTSKTQ